MTRETFLAGLMIVQSFSWDPPSTNSARDLSSFLETQRKELGFPALAAAVTSERVVLAAGAAGKRKVGDEAAVTLEDKFHIGSCTKSMTALLAVMLANEGKIHLTNHVADVLRDWRMGDAYKESTLEMLLQHRSGIMERAPRRLWRRAFSELTGSPSEQRETFARELLQLDLEHEPGEKFLYSNLGYALAGVMIEKAAGKPWEELMQERIFAPLKMSSAGHGPPASPDTVDQPWGHVWKDGKAETAPRRDNPIAIAPAGGVHCSIVDLAKYAAFHLAILRGKIPELAQSRDELYSAPARQQYALGWLAVNQEWAGGRAFTHSGSNTMFHCVIWIAPARNIAFIVATNVGDGRGEERTFELCDRVLGELIKSELLRK